LLAAVSVVALRGREYKPSLDCGGYKHYTVSEAQELLRGRQIVFAGDSLMRKLYYEFSQTVILGSPTIGEFGTKKDKTILRSVAILY
jgi:hypothetical protein